MEFGDRLGRIDDREAAGQPVDDAAGAAALSGDDRVPEDVLSLAGGSALAGEVSTRRSPENRIVFAVLFHQSVGSFHRS